ncbi:MAG: hypothetical protein JF601_03285, partial [Acidobacteria bacterium]|nr:hypothetical protein [Acidobacteriota bacterium]
GSPEELETGFKLAYLLLTEPKIEPAAFDQFQVNQRERLADPHLTEMTDHLGLTSGLVKASLAREGTDEEREAWFTDEVRRELRRRMTIGDAQAYEVAGRFDLSWRGLARYWRKRGSATR